MKITMFILALVLVISGCGDGEGMKMDRKVAREAASLQ